MIIDRVTVLIRLAMTYYYSVYYHCYNTMIINRVIINHG